LRWHLHDIDPEVAPGERSLRHQHVLRSLAARLARREQPVRVRVLAHTRLELALERLKLTPGAPHNGAPARAPGAPELLELPGCGPLTAAKLIAETPARGAFRRTPSSLATRASRHCPHPPGRATATASTGAATGN